MFSDFEINHPVARWKGDLRRQAKRRAKDRRDRVAAERQLPKERPLIPGFSDPIVVLPKLPTSELVSDKGVPLGGFADDRKAMKVEGATQEQWSERLHYMNEKCGRIYGGRGSGRKKGLRVREACTEQVFGNVRLDLSFAMRRAAMSGMDVKSPMYRMLDDLIAGLEAQFPGVRVGGALVHPPNPYVGDAERQQGRNEKATGLNLHPQLYLFEAFGGFWLTKTHRGVTNCKEVTVIALHQDALGIDVNARDRVREAVEREWRYRVSTQNDWIKWGFS